MGSRILNEKKPPVQVKLDRKLVRSKLRVFVEREQTKLSSSERKVRATTSDRLLKDMIEFVMKVIEPQLKKGFRLDLSDELVQKKIGVTRSRSKVLRLKLKDAGVIWFPEWSRPKKPGHYPLWLVAKDFLVYQTSPEKRKTKKEREEEMNSRYHPEYFKIYSEVCSEVYRDLEEDDRFVTLKEYMIEVNIRLNLKLKTMGLTRDMLKR